MAAIPTPVTKLLGCEHPVLLAGMGRASRPPLVAAVCNAGGCGVLAATRYTPAMLREAIADLKVCALRTPKFALIWVITLANPPAAKTQRPLFAFRNRRAIPSSWRKCTENQRMLA